MKLKGLMVSIAAAAGLFMSGCQLGTQIKGDCDYKIEDGKAMFGLLGGANVNIYELESDGTKKLLYTEKTEYSFQLDKSGNFNTHKDDLDDNKFYIYEISGGKQMNKYDICYMDKVPEENNATVYAIAKGKWIKNSDGFIVSLATDMMYRFAQTKMKYDTSNLEDALNEIAQKFLKVDINKDGKIDAKDVYEFDPIKNNRNIL